MSASPMARQVTENKSIPRRVIITDPRDLPADYSSTPGGTLYSTTPGGSKIVYEKSFLINLRNSPISKTPPKWDIPEDLMRGSGNDKKAKSPSALKQSARNNNSGHQQKTRTLSVSDDQDQFQMDM
ncbi:PREDICTED: eukaryotic translation initiation factor 4E-binding protein 1 [Nicrophorus vespilloides]|uniref:Eukaryotic translation initiation factor 4E-binding protein 1 n=1 Tax=Nicrophorus vespilloides TaxID=110193 RepID=A0ABM1N0C6_NICVS|nr:PREDICTED: eukaryotic translation initiation factor 4E-binding protein 1 [Nicrophorus vespilloides]